jgi:peptide/nickel transport system permease protein
VGVFFTFTLGLLLGGISGYLGGVTDTIIQRSIDVIVSIPTIPLWMGLAAAVPRNWSPVRTYLAIVIITSFISWAGLARVVRGKLLSVREEDFTMAARLAGVSDLTIILRHLLPSMISYVIVSLTLSIPGTILGETALSFLGLGLQPPVVSWGVLLQDAQNLETIAHHAWLLWPAAWIIVTVLMFNFLGDGLRDAADPYR